MAGGSRYSSGRKPDPIRNSFETIRTPANLAKPLQQQQLRCKVCMEQVSGRPDRMKEHKNKCIKPPSQVCFVISKKFNCENLIKINGITMYNKDLILSHFLLRILILHHLPQVQIHRRQVQLHLPQAQIHRCQVQLHQPQVHLLQHLPALKILENQSQRDQQLSKTPSSTQHLLRRQLCKSSGRGLFTRIASRSPLQRIPNSRKRWR